MKKVYFAMVSVLAIMASCHYYYITKGSQPLSFNLSSFGGSIGLEDVCTRPFCGPAREATIVSFEECLNWGDQEAKLLTCTGYVVLAERTKPGSPNRVQIGMIRKKELEENPLFRVERIVVKDGYLTAISSCSGLRLALQYIIFFILAAAIVGLARIISPPPKPK